MYEEVVPSVFWEANLRSEYDGEVVSTFMVRIPFLNVVVPPFMLLSFGSVPVPVSKKPAFFVYDSEVKIVFALRHIFVPGIV